MALLRISKRNGAIMRRTEFPAEAIATLLRKQRIATLPELMAALGTDARRTVFRKLAELRCRTSYSHRGSFYTLDEVAEFDDRGLWSYRDVWFSSYGTLLSTATPMTEMPPFPNNYFGEPLIHKLLVYLLRNDPPGTTLFLNPFAFAGWVGLLVTFLNLFPVGQLDGGHVRYALFGSRADKFQEWLAKAMLGWGCLGMLNLILWVVLGTDGPLVRFLLSWCSPAYFIWGILLVTIFGRAGWEHPPVLEWEPLSPGRKIIAAVGIAIFILVFMPAPIATELG